MTVTIKDNLVTVNGIEIGMVEQRDGRWVFSASEAALGMSSGEGALARYLDEISYPSLDQLMHTVWHEVADRWERLAR